jgi:hypothetical protein
MMIGGECFCDAVLLQHGCWAAVAKLQTLRQDNAAVCALHLLQALPPLYLAAPHLDVPHLH